MFYLLSKIFHFCSRTELDKALEDQEAAFKTLKAELNNRTREVSILCGK